MLLKEIKSGGKFLCYGIWERLSSQFKLNLLIIVMAYTWKGIASMKPITVTMVHGKFMNWQSVDVTVSGYNITVKILGDMCNYLA